VTWLGRLLRGRRMERELDRELSDHIERQTAGYVAAGLGAAEARRRALLEFGGIEQTKEECRDARGTRLASDLAQDLRYGLRVLRKSPGFTFVAIASLALGIGANTAIFTLVDSLLLRALPVRDPGQLVRLEGGSWTNPIWEEIRERRHELFENAAAFWGTRLDLASGGEARFAEAILASGEFFDVLGVPALLGRTFTRDDDRHGGGASGPVAVISYAYWQRQYGGQADAVGRSLTLNGVPFTIVGVTPMGFFGPTVGRGFDVAVPIGMVDRVQPNGTRSWLEGRSSWWLDIVARLKSGQTLEAATQLLRAVQPQIREATLPSNWRPQDLEKYLREQPFALAPATTGFSDIRGEYRRPLLTVMGVVGLVLLIACANLASLLLARANGRRQELAARLALGASRQRLARQLLAECLLLALPGALLGLAVAQWGSRLLVRQIATQSGLVTLDVSLHWRVLLFTLAVTLATALLFGVAPALRASRFSPHDAIRPQGRGVAGEGPAAVGGPLVVAQVALSLVLVFAAGLFLRTFSHLASQDLGLDDSQVLVVRLNAQRCSVGAGQLSALFGGASEQAAAVPGVAHATVSLIEPLSGQGWNERFVVPGGPVLSDRDQLSWVNAVTPGFFATYGTRLVAGRDFDARDRAGAPLVGVVNEAFVRRFIGGEHPNPIGRVVEREGPPGQPAIPFEIVGLVHDAVYGSPRDPIEPTVYVAIAQLGQDESWPVASLAVRGSTGSPSLLIRPIAEAMGRVDPKLSLTFRLFSDQVGASMRRERIVAMLSGFFGFLALFLAGLGLYGVTSYAVIRRRTEIGVRMALGADAAGVVRLVLGKVGLLLGLGIALGALISLWLSRFVEGLVFGMPPRDPATLVGAAAVLVAVGLLAAGLPARRASRIDPATVLREG
jgi:putative ABC transport system permease protein